jgi:hypothetical protein
MNDNTSSLKDTSLAARVEKITEALEERKHLVEEGTQVLRGAAESLKAVRAKYEPVKSHSSVLVSTSKNATSCIEEVARLLSCLKVHEKVRYLAALVNVAAPIFTLLLYQRNLIISLRC